MRYVVDDRIVKKRGLTMPQFLAALLLKTGVNAEDIYEGMEQRRMITRGLLGNYVILQPLVDTCESILLDSEKETPKDDELEPLALQMMEIVPQCKKTGTAYYFKGNKREIVLRLKKFFKLYGRYSNEDILEALQRYVNSFNGDYTYMKLLKYFIIKDEKKLNSEGQCYIEETSQLATELENLDSSDGNNADWINDLK